MGVSDVVARQFGNKPRLEDQLGILMQAMMPAALGQQHEANKFMRGDMSLEDTYAGKMLVGPENLAYKAAQGRALENLPRGGQLNQAMGQIEAGRAQQDAQASQSATGMLLGGPPILSGITQVGGQQAGIQAQKAQLGAQQMAGMGQLIGLSLGGLGGKVGGAGGGAGGKK